MIRLCDLEPCRAEHASGGVYCVYMHDAMIVVEQSSYFEGYRMFYGALDFSQVCVPTTLEIARKWYDLDELEAQCVLNAILKGEVTLEVSP